MSSLQPDPKENEKETDSTSHTYQPSAKKKRKLPQGFPSVDGAYAELTGGLLEGDHVGTSDAGLEMITDSDILDITKKANLTKGDLRELFMVLDLAQHEIENAEVEAGVNRVHLQAASVLQFWRKTRGRAATKRKILNALRTCEFIESMEILQEKWRLPESVPKAPVEHQGLTSASELVNIVVEDLKLQYLNSLCKKQVYPWKSHEFVALDKIYVPVTIDIKIPGARTIKERLDSYQDLFSDTETSTRFLLTGNPGQGKSTFCSKIAFDWSHNELRYPLKHIKLLFILQLGLIDHRSSIESAICSQLLSNLPGIDAQKLGTIIRSLGRSVVIVLDGLDEAPLDLLEHQNIGNLVSTITYTDLRNCRVLITTRPWREHEITQFPVYTRLEIQKMKKSDVKAYVQKFFGQNEDDFSAVILGKRLERHISENKLLADTSTPLVVLLICWFWIETEGKREIPERIGELYDQIISLMYRSQEHPVADKETTVNQLGKLAVVGLTPQKTPRILFTEDEIKKCHSHEFVKQVCAMGIMWYRNKNARTLQFFHKSGQEFCSGSHLSKHSQELISYLEEVRNVKDALSVGLVLAFAARAKPAAKQILGKLMGIFASEIQFQMSQYYSSELSFDKIQTIQQFIELCLECNFEADAKSEFHSNMRDLFPDGKVIFYGMSSKATISLAYYMTYCRPDAIRDITLHPIAHASEPPNEYGPTGEIFNTALRSMKSLPEERVKQIHDKFKATNTDLHKEWEQYNPALLAAYIPCIQAYEGLPSPAETNVLPLIRTLKRIKIERLAANKFKLGSNFDHILQLIDNGDMESLLDLYAMATGLSGRQITKLASSLHKMPSLRVLNIAENEIEAGQSIPVLAENLKSSTSLKELFVYKMCVPAEEMELLSQGLPSQLTVLDMASNGMNDAVAVHLIRNMPRRLTRLDINVWHLSEEKHNDLVHMICHTLRDLRELRIFESPFAVNLVKHGGSALNTCIDLNTLLLQASGNTLIPEDCAELFIQGVQGARNVRNLWLGGICFDKRDWERFVAACRETNVKELHYFRELLPEGVSPEEQDDFVMLR